MNALTLVGAGLLEVCLTHRVASIAGKPAPTGFGVEGMNHG